MRWLDRVLLGVVVCGAAATHAAPPLGPGDLALVYNSFVPASRELAEYYASRRGVPADRLIGLPCGIGDEIQRQHFDVFEENLRKALREAGLENRVRCLVLFYGLPIRVGPFRPTPAQQALAASLDKDLTAVAAEFRKACADLELLAGLPSTRAAEPPKDKPANDLKDLSDRYARVATAIVRQIQAEADAEKRAAIVRRFFLLLQQVEGPAGLFKHVNSMPPSTHPSAESSMQVLRTDLEQQEQRINALMGAPIDSPQRADARRLIREFQGVLGSVRVLYNDRNRLEGSETEASFDSELAVLWWDDYPLYRWILNLQAWRVRADPALLQAVRPDEWRRKVLMVSRLDAAKPDIVRRMIDESLDVEARGLAGTFYIDARGLPKDSSYGAYDENLRNLADLVTARKSYPVALDNKPELFQAGACPDTAMYCGWYSLRKYVPAFRFAHGAVGYHIASAEAVSLSGGSEQGWCKRMLDDGAAATLGPVAEPYLHAFPLPRDFFGLLMTGRFTLAESFAYTSPFNSWMIMLLGDPLYRPFAVRPALMLGDVFPREMVPPEFGGTATEPASRPAGAVNP